MSSVAIDEKINHLFSNPDMMNVFIEFFDHKDKYLNTGYLMRRARISKNKLLDIIKELEKQGWVREKKGLYRFVAHPKDVERALFNQLASFHAIESIFMNKVKDDFEDYKSSIVERTEQMSSQISILTLLNEVSQEFAKILSFDGLYKKVTELAVANLGFEGAEIFLVEGSKDKIFYRPVSLFYSNFQHLMYEMESYAQKANQDMERVELFNEALAQKEEIIINDPLRLSKISSAPDQYASMAVLPIFQDDKPFAVIQVGYLGEDKIIGVQDKQKIDYLIHNMNQDIIIISLYESLEEKINQRTSELQAANVDLLKFNEELNILNREIKREMVAASAIQKAILPDTMPYPKEVSIAGKLKAMPDPTLSEAERKAIEISGDYFDVFEIGAGKVGVIIADVTGHGIPSALITTMAKISFYTHSVEGGSTADICYRVNKDIFEAIGVGDTGFYVTVFFAVYDTNTGELQYTNAGHHKGVLIRKGEKKIEELDTPGFFIGSFDGAEYEHGETVLKEGDKLVLYTDGIVETRNQDGRFYEDIFFDRLLALKDKSSEQVIDYIWKDVDEFRGDSPEKDDRTIVALEPLSIKNPAQKASKKSVAAKKEGENPSDDNFKQRLIQVVKDFNQKRFTEQLEKDVEMLLPVVKSPKNKQYLYYIKGVILTKQEHYEQALKAFHDALNIIENHVGTLNYLGFCYFKLKDYPQAKKYWEKTLALSPNQKSVEQNLDFLKKHV